MGLTACRVEPTRLHPFASLPHVPFAGALLFSIAAHVAAILFVHLEERASRRPPPRSMLVSVVPTAPTAPAAAALTQPHSHRTVTPRATPSSVSAAPTPTSPATPADIAPPDEPVASADADAMQAPGPVAGIGIFGGLQPIFGGGTRRRWFNQQAATQHELAGAGFAAQRAALAAQLAEAQMIGALFLQLSERWRALGPGAGECRVRRSADQPVTECDTQGPDQAIERLAEAPESRALLERFGCLRFDRGEAGGSVRPCS